MDNDANSANQQSASGKPNQKPENERLAEGIERTEKQPYTNDDKTNPTRKPNLILRLLRVLWRRRRWRIIGGHNVPNWAEAAIVFLTFGILGVGYLQYTVYRTQARLMRSSLEQNERNIILNRGQLAVAARSATAAEQAADVASDTLTEIQHGGKDTHNLARAAIDQAIATKSEAISAAQQGNMAYLEERPWLTVSKPLIAYTSASLGEIPSLANLQNISVKLTNSGKTPATDLRVGIKGIVVPIGEFLRSGLEDEYEINQLGNLPPGVDVYLRVDASKIIPFPFNQQNISQLAEPSPTHRLFIIGIFSYNDLINPRFRHYACFSFILAPNMDIFGIDSNPRNNAIWDSENK